LTKLLHGIVEMFRVQVLQISATTRGREALEPVQCFRTNPYEYWTVFNLYYYLKVLISSMGTDERSIQDKIGTKQRDVTIEATD
jgi:hypothetical protein